VSIFTRKDESMALLTVIRIIVREYTEPDGATLGVALWPGGSVWLPSGSIADDILEALDDFERSRPQIVRSTREELTSSTRVVQSAIIGGNGGGGGSSNLQLDPGS